MKTIGLIVFIAFVIFSVPAIIVGLSWVVKTIYEVMYGLWAWWYKAYSNAIDYMLGGRK